MPAPSPLAIATSSVTRLVKEASSYRTELADQQQRLRSLEADKSQDEEGNRTFQIEQQKRAVKETEAIFGPLGQRLDLAVEALESLLEASGEGKGDGSNEEQVEKARQAVQQAKMR